MLDIAYPIDWSSDYPDNCTLPKLRSMLKKQAALWRGWDEFPWYLTRTLHRHMDRPPADWDHLHTFFWMQGHAAHVLLKEKFENRNAVLRLLLEHRVQFVGIFRHIVLDQIHWCLLFNKRDRLPDCALWGADTPEAARTLEEKRELFRGGIELAVAEYVRLLDFASEVGDADEWMAGHPLRVWFRGAHLPESVEVPVRLSEENGREFLRPVAKTSARFLGRRVPIPRIEVEPGGLVDDDAQIDVATVRTTTDEETSRKIAFRVFDLATQIDEGARTKPPAHSTVLRLYCCEELSVNQIAKKCGCSHATVMNRKGDLEEKLGMSLEAFRRHAAMLKVAAETAEYAKAKKIQRRNLLN